MEVVPVPKDKYGSFYKGDCYIVYSVSILVLIPLMPQRFLAFILAKMFQLQHFSGNNQMQNVRTQLTTHFQILLNPKVVLLKLFRYRWHMPSTSSAKNGQ